MKLIKQVTLASGAALMVLPFAISAFAADTVAADGNSVTVEATAKEMAELDVDKKCRKRGCDDDTPHRS